MIDVSVIYSFYNIKLQTSAFASIKSVLLQKNINKEVIIVEQNNKKSEGLEDFCKKHKIKYLFVDNLTNSSNIGFLKNIAIANATGKYLYFNDLDVILVDKFYLLKLVNFMNKNNCKNLVRPKMLRLLNNHNEFCKNFHKINYKNVSSCFINYEHNKIKSLQNESYALINNLVHVRIGENTNQNFNENQIKNFDWQLNFHCGGLICDRDLVHNIGAFSLAYCNWGMEDIDFQWRLNEFYGTRLINDCVSDLIVVHIEHQSRADNERYKKNREIFSLRREKGLKSSIKEDLKNFEKIKETFGGK